MKKSLFPRLALMAVVVALVSACSQKKQEYTDVIPANAHTVVSINLKSLADKAGLNDKENKEVQEKLTNALKSGMNAATFQQMEMIMKESMYRNLCISSPRKHSLLLSLPKSAVKTTCMHCWKHWRKKKSVSLWQTVTVFSSHKWGIRYS